MELNEVTAIELEANSLEVGRKTKVVVEGRQLELRQTQSPSLDRRLRGTGSAYVVSLEGVGKIGEIRSTLMANNPLAGPGKSKGAHFVAWGATPYPMVSPGMKPRKTTWRWHRQEALGALLEMYQEKTGAKLSGRSS